MECWWWKDEWSVGGEAMKGVYQVDKNLIKKKKEEERRFVCQSCLTKKQGWKRENSRKRKQYRVCACA